MALEAMTFQNGKDVLLEECDLRGTERLWRIRARRGFVGNRGQRKDKHHHGRSNLSGSHGSASARRALGESIYLTARGQRWVDCLDGFLKFLAGAGVTPRSGR